MNQTHRLIGTWEFISAEQYENSRWQKASYVEGMTWTFFPQYVSQTKTLGDMIETAPMMLPVSMPYAYDRINQLLKIEIFTDIEKGIYDESEADIYELTRDPDKEIMTLSIRDQNGPESFRYILKKHA